MKKENIVFIGHVIFLVIFFGWITKCMSLNLYAAEGSATWIFFGFSSITIFKGLPLFGALNIILGGLIFPIFYYFGLSYIWKTLYEKNAPIRYLWAPFFIHVLGTIFLFYLDKNLLKEVVKEKSYFSSYCVPITLMITYWFFYIGAFLKWKKICPSINKNVKT